MLELTQNYKSVLDKTVEIAKGMEFVRLRVYIVPVALYRAEKPSSRTLKLVKTDRQIKSRTELSSVLKTTDSRISGRRGG